LLSLFLTHIKCRNHNVDKERKIFNESDRKQKYIFIRNAFTY